MFAKVFSEDGKNPVPSQESDPPETPGSAPGRKLPPIKQQRTAEDIAIESLVKIDVGRKGKGRKVRDKLRTWKGNAKQAIDERNIIEDKSSIKSAASPNQGEGSEGVSEGGSSSDTSDNDSDSGPEGDDKDSSQPAVPEEGTPEGAQTAATPASADGEHDIEMGIAVEAIDSADGVMGGDMDKDSAEASPQPPPEPPQPTKEEIKKRMKEFRRQKKAKALQHGGKAIQSLHELWREQVDLKNEYIKEEAFLNAHKQKVRRERGRR